MDTPIKLYRLDGDPITNWDSWTRPKKDYQWVAGRSATELAKASFHDSVADFENWSKGDFASKSVARELPILAFDENGSVISGIVDLVVETGEGI